MKPKHLSRLYKIFQDKNWGRLPKSEAVFERFCKIVAGFGKDSDVELFLLLTEDFEVYDLFRYQPLLREAMYDIKPGLPKHIIFAPGSSPSDIDGNKNKSGDMLTYMAKTVAQQIETFDGKMIYAVTDYRKIPEKCSKKEGKKHLFLVDDFSGSGDTMRDAVSAALTSGFLLKEITAVILVAQTQAIESLITHEIDVVWGVNKDKGISDNGRIPDKGAAIRIMREFAQKIGVPSMYELGYGQCESLVSMMRTPNNTLPIYWYRCQLWDPPFPRE